MKTAELDYDLPPELIAQHPCPERTASRLMVLHRQEMSIEHRTFADLSAYLRPGDCLVLNDSRVLPARFFLQRQTGGLIEGLYLSEPSPGHWVVLLKNAGRVKPGEQLSWSGSHPPIDSIEDTDAVTARERLEQGRWLLDVGPDQPALSLLQRHGRPPLPPYIRRDKDASAIEDRDRYQTVYASNDGSIAAPTAGLHFSEELLSDLQKRRILTVKVTLHVGLGTFKGVEADDLNQHRMHQESYEVPEQAARMLGQVRDAGDRVVCVGTTSVRTLESAATQGQVQAEAGTTDLFITPGYTFQVSDVLITNFHLPRSTLLALVMAFAGVDLTRQAYEAAVKEKYRFFSYGDAMMIL